MSPKLSSESARGKRGRVHIDVDVVHPYRGQERCDVVDYHPTLFSRFGHDVIVGDHHFANLAARVHGSAKQASLEEACHDGAVCACHTAVKVGSYDIGRINGQIQISRREIVFKGNAKAAFEGVTNRGNLLVSAQIDEEGSNSAAASGGGQR